MAIEIVQALPGAEHTPTEPLSPMAVYAMHRVELALADRTVAHFDHWGSVFGFSTVEDTEKDIAESRAEGAVIDEWETVDRDGQSLRVVRATHPEWGIDIHAFSTWDTRRKAVAR
ncbi:hypothetical protein [Streptomyces sp. NPDC003395]